MANGEPWSQEFVQRHLRDLLAPWGTDVGTATLDKFEGGRAPEWRWLVALSIVYGVSLNETLRVLLGSFAANSVGFSGLLSQLDDVKDSSGDGGPPLDDSHTRLYAELAAAQKRLKEVRGIARDSQRLAQRLITITSDRYTGDAAASAEPGIG